MECNKACDSLISVIVPVYKVEKYLRRCIDSIIAQSYDNLEIILVDDGSPDECGRICDEYASADSRIKVIHKENGGLSDARNSGTEMACGEYITFVDSDDYIAPHFIEYLYGLLTDNNADISCCCMVKTDCDSADFGSEGRMQKEQVLSGKECCYALFGDLYLTLVTAWGKLYKTEIVKKFLFPLGKKHEDEATTCKYYYHAEKVAVGNACLYAYYQRADSIMHTLDKGINVDAIWALEHRARFFEEKGEVDLARTAWRVFFYYCVNDTLKYKGRCDKYLVDFEQGKSLSKLLRAELWLFNFSRFLFRIYRKLLFKYRGLKRRILHR